MSGRIYDYGINPKCDICGSKMWSSSDTNFNGCQCTKKGCKGKPIYEPFKTSNPNIKFENGKYILECVFTSFGKTNNNIDSTQMWKDIKKWIIIIFSWLIILIFSLILLDNKSMILCGWLLITVLVMWLKGKDYEKWYCKNYANIRGVERDANK